MCFITVIKKIFLHSLLFFASIFFFTVLTAAPSLAEDFKIENNILLEYHGSGGDITIPSTVAVIGPNVFLNNSHITTVTIPEGVFEISDNAFGGCDQMQNVHFPSSLKKIGKEAFSYCQSMRELNLPTGLTTIGEGAFANCHSIRKIEIPKTVSTITHSAFSNCSGVEYFSVASGNTAYTEEDGVLYTSDKKVLIAYPLARKDTSFEIPDGVKYLERNSFAYQSTLNDIHFPDTLKEIRPFAFRNCIGLRKITFPETLERIFEYSFMYCSNLNKVYYLGDDTQTLVHTYDGDFSVTVYANEGSQAKHHTDLYNMNWLPLHDTETIILPKDKTISHKD